LIFKETQAGSTLHKHKTITAITCSLICLKNIEVYLVKILHQKIEKYNSHGYNTNYKQKVSPLPPSLFTEKKQC